MERRAHSRLLGGAGRFEEIATKDNVETGSLKPDAGAGQREGFAAAYGSEHEGRDAKQSSG